MKTETVTTALPAIYNFAWQAVLPLLKTHQRLKKRFSRRTSAAHFSKCEIWVQAAVMVLLETELQPWLLACLKKRNTHIPMVNVRLSGNSFKSYLPLGGTELHGTCHGRCRSGNRPPFKKFSMGGEEISQQKIMHKTKKLATGGKFYDKKPCSCS